MKGRFLVIVAAVIISSGGDGGSTYIYLTQFSPRTVMQTNPNTVNCRQRNLLYAVEKQARFTVLSTCEIAGSIVHDMKGTKEADGDYEFSLDVEQPYKKLLNVQNNSHRNGMLVVSLLSRAKKEGRRGLTGFADLGSFFSFEKLEELMRYELWLPQKNEEDIIK